MNVICIDHGVTERAINRARKGDDPIFYRSTDGKHVTVADVVANEVRKAADSGLGFVRVSPQSLVEGAAELLGVP